MTSIIRPMTRDDADAIVALRDRNREALAPTAPDSWFDRSADDLRASIGADGDHRFVILDSGGAPAGAINLSNLVRGPFQNAIVGYWVAPAFQGRGLATTALAAVCTYAYGEVGLHRIEAATLPDNHASQRVLEKNGFTRIGLAPRYLHIAGAWRDHVVFARTAEDPPGTA